MLRTPLCRRSAVVQWKRPRNCVGYNGLSAEVKIYGSYEAVVDDPEIDPVYVPLPNESSTAVAVVAAEDGRSNLLLDEARCSECGGFDEIAAACEGNGVAVSWTVTNVMHHPVTPRSANFLSDCRPSLGKLKMRPISFTSSKSRFNELLRPDWKPKRRASKPEKNGHSISRKTQRGDRCGEGVARIVDPSVMSSYTYSSNYLDQWPQNLADGQPQCGRKYKIAGSPRKYSGERRQRPEVVRSFSYTTATGAIDEARAPEASTGSTAASGPDDKNFTKVHNASDQEEDELDKPMEGNEERKWLQASSTACVGYQKLSKMNLEIWRLPTVEVEMQEAKKCNKINGYGGFISEKFLRSGIREDRKTLGRFCFSRSKCDGFASQKKTGIVSHKLQKKKSQVY
ncbi:putative oxidoreductase, partial [Cucurbita argyrosperma subsp. argyrosperma]